MRNKGALIALAAILGVAAGCSKNDTGTSPTGDNGYAGSSSNTTAKKEPVIPIPPKPFVVPAGTTIPVILSSSLNSRIVNSGDQFEASVAENILVENEVAIPKGASVTGSVVNAKKQGTFKGEADLAVRLTRVEVRGKGYMIATNTYAATVKGKGKRTAIVTGGGAALGALIGGLAGGGKGAAIGAGVGGGGGLAASGTTGGKNVEFPAESRLTFKLEDAVTIDR